MALQYLVSGLALLGFMALIGHRFPLPNFVHIVIVLVGVGMLGAALVISGRD
ncbi:hypothetical protein [Devosia sediminis]|uniref:Uncharacterized protein n=1 Tax=Devosia sediminis TaxID=2798801 RepID=A0A934J008_9HYPH|nr:hypothetical protein [Devosia sediminis]MBJ3786386.1 hypothetical protein [Devosia sediminis]